MVVVLILGAFISCGPKEFDPESLPADFPAEGKQVIGYLLEDWQKQLRSTSIPLAMSNLEIEPNDDLRLKIGQYFRDNTDLAKNLKWWGANNYILSNGEKLIAKYLINTYGEGVVNLHCYFRLETIHQYYKLKFFQYHAKAFPSVSELIKISRNEIKPMAQEGYKSFIKKRRLIIPNGAQRRRCSRRIEGFLLRLCPVSESRYRGAVPIPP